MGWMVMKKVGTKLASEKLSQVRELGGGGRMEERRDGSQGGPYNNNQKKLSYWLNIFSARVFFLGGFERDCEILSGSKSTCIPDARNKAKKSSKQTKVQQKLSLSFFLSLSLSNLGKLGM
jgi:hypothetical protein